VPRSATFGCPATPQTDLGGAGVRLKVTYRKYAFGEVIHRREEEQIVFGNLPEKSPAELTSREYNLLLLATD
jgi:hypothetical protein